MIATLAGVLCAALLPAAAQGADRIYWANGEPDTISFANLDGSGGGNVVTTGASLTTPLGAVPDLGTGRVYWPNFGTGFISFANLDGSGGGGDLKIDPEAVTATVLTGLSIDPVARRVYWTNLVSKAILFGGPLSVANLDGSNAKDLEIVGATVDHPQGIAVDHGAGKIYWANRSGKISTANLDGGDAKDLNTAGATAGTPAGLAVDPAAGLVYWTDTINDRISFAHLDGSGGGDLEIKGATVNNPRGIAVDHEAGRIYWANENAGLSFAKLDGSGGGDLKTGAVTLAHPSSPSLLLTPRSTAMPEISGSPEVGSPLSCSKGSWAADVPVSFLYRAPQSFAFQWTDGGRAIPGATASSFTPRVGGVYRCQVTAQNAAGETTQTTATVRVPAEFASKTSVTITLLSRRIPATGPVKVRVANRNPFQVTGKLKAQVKALGASLKPKPKKLRVAAQGRKTFLLKLSTPVQRLLRSRHRLSIRLTVTVRDQVGAKLTVTKTVAPKLRAGLSS